jgi:hypothetical protein
VLQYAIYLRKVEMITSPSLGSPLVYTRVERDYNKWHNRDLSASIYIETITMLKTMSCCCGF